MNLLRSMCCLFGGRCAEEEARPTTETTRREAPVLAKGKLSERRPAKTSLNTWKADNHHLPPERHWAITGTRNVGDSVATPRPCLDSHERNA